MSRNKTIAGVIIVAAILFLVFVFFITGSPEEVPSLADNVPGADAATEPTDPVEDVEGE